MIFACACRLGLEGIVSKRKDSAYGSGRSPDWLKMKNSAERCDVRRRKIGDGSVLASAGGEGIAHATENSTYARVLAGDTSHYVE